MKMKEEPSAMKDYLKSMTLAGARMMFNLQLGTTKSIKYNTLSDKKFASQNWQCSNDCINAIESFQHVAFMCPRYESLRTNRDLVNNEQHLVDFFFDIIKIRDEAYPE